MTGEDPKNPRKHSPYTAAVNMVLVQFTVKALTPDPSELKNRERKGRPQRSPSLPPEEPKPDQNPPAAT
jgi:hypothetical protein